MTIAVYPGSFDPVTNGHLDIATRAVQLFDTVIMAVYDRPNKNLLFSTEERVALLREATNHLPSIRVETYSGMTVSYVRSTGARAIIRGLRSASDFESEFRMAQINRSLEPDIDVVLLMAGHQYTFCSSSMVREIASLGGDISWLVPTNVVPALQRAYGHSVQPAASNLPS